MVMMTGLRELRRILLFGCCVAMFASICADVTAEEANTSAARPGGSAPTTSTKEIQLVTKIGETIPLDLVFTNEEGREILLRDVIKDRPTLLTMVYFTCPGICSPMLHHLQKNIGKIKLMPGADYNLLTVSFDQRDTPAAAKERRDGALQGIPKEMRAPGNWHFFTGKEKSIRALANAVGFGFKFKPATADSGATYVHSAAQIFLDKNGKVTSYLTQIEPLSKDVEMGLYYAMDGKEIPLIKRLERLCYGQAPKGRGYALMVDRIVLFATLCFGAIFVLFMRSLGKARLDESVASDTPTTSADDKEST